MRKFSWITVALVLLSIAGLTAGQSQNNYRIYHNARFDYSISYPADILIPQGEAVNGDGQKFLSRDNRTEMLAYGSPQWPESYVRNCLVVPREGDDLFFIPDGLAPQKHVLAMLDGYAVIPMDEYPKSN